MNELLKFADRVRAMRDAQKAYFSSKRGGYSHAVCNQKLATAREIEREVDQAVTEILDVTPSLFERGAA